MTQLVAPNLNAQGRIGYCLEFAARVWGTTFVPDPPYAWTAWQQTTLRLASIPSDVAVPCWFEYDTGGIEEGHVVAWIPGKGFLSSPYSLSADAQYQEGTTTHALLPSIAEVERIYGVKFVGCSQDILNLRVVEDEPMLNSGDVTNMYFALLGHDADAQTKTNWTGHTFKELFYAIVDSDEYKLKPTVPTDYILNPVPTYIKK